MQHATYQQDDRHRKGPDGRRLSAKRARQKQLSAKQQVQGLTKKLSSQNHAVATLEYKLAKQAEDEGPGFKQYKEKTETEIKRLNNLLKVAYKEISQKEKNHKEIIKNKDNEITRKTVSMGKLLAHMAVLVKKMPEPKALQHGTLYQHRVPHSVVIMICL